MFAQVSRVLRDVSSETRPPENLCFGLKSTNQKQAEADFHIEADLKFKHITHTYTYTLLWNIVLDVGYAIMNIEAYYFIFPERFN